MPRPASIPKELAPVVLSLAEAGLGARCIARVLETHRCWTTKSSVARLLKDLPPYEPVQPNDTKMLRRREG